MNFTLFAGAAQSMDEYAEALKGMEVQTNLHGRLTCDGLLAFYAQNPGLATDLLHAGLGSLDDTVLAGVSITGESLLKTHSM